MTRAWRSLGVRFGFVFKFLRGLARFMSLFTSTHFASAAASGTDWRDTSKTVLEKLESVRMSPNSFNLGFLYIADHMADDAVSIVNLFRSVLGVEHWVGSVGMGVLGAREAFVDEPAIAAMVGKFPPESFCIFPQTDEFAGSEAGDSQAGVKAWLGAQQPFLTLVHVDPMAREDPEAVIRRLEAGAQTFIVGGLTSSRAQHYQIADVVCENTVSGVFFSPAVKVASSLSQGCEPMGPSHVVTRAHEGVISELDGRRALEVFQEDLRRAQAEKTGRKLEEFQVDLRGLSAAEQIPAEFLPLFQGQVHVALTHAQSDRQDFMARNITGLNADEGSISIAHRVETGNRLFFALRTQESVCADLRRSLQSLKARVEHDHGSFAPKGGLYFSCIARGFGMANKNYEMEIIHEILGDFPLAGFFAGGEISNARLYGYTGVMVLFL